MVCEVCGYEAEVKNKLDDLKVCEICFEDAIEQGDRDWDRHKEQEILGERW